MLTARRAISAATEGSPRPNLPGASERLESGEGKSDSKQKRKLAQHRGRVARVAATGRPK